MQYEEALDLAGGFGRYQIAMFFCLGAPGIKYAFSVIFHFLSVYQMNYRCADFSNLTQMTYVQPEKGQLNIMHMQDTHWTMGENFTYDNACYSGNNSGVNIWCEKFYFEPITMHSTLVSEMSLVCKRAWWVNFLKALPNMGVICGQILGSLMDNYFHLGRRQIMIICFTADTLFTGLGAIMPDPISQAVFKFLRGIPLNLGVFQGVILVTELTNVKWRSFVGNAIWLFWCLGLIIAPGIAYVNPERKFLDLILLVPCLFYIPVYIFAPESPRWLLLNKKEDEATNLFKKMARINGETSIPNNFQIKMDKVVTENLFKSLLRYSKLRLKFVALCVLTFAHSFAYFGISMDLEFADANIFLSTLLGGIIEVPSAFLGWLLCETRILGRRWSTLIMQILAGICIILVAFISNNSWMKIILAIFGKLNLTAAFSVLILYTMELFPTPIRNTGILVTGFVNTSGAILAAFVTKTKDMPYLPNLLFGGIAISTALLLCLLPETRGVAMPQTVAESENQIVVQEVAKDVQVPLTTFSEFGAEKIA